MLRLLKLNFLVLIFSIGSEIFVNIKQLQFLIRTSWCYSLVTGKVLVINIELLTYLNFELPDL